MKTFQRLAFSALLFTNSAFSQQDIQLVGKISQPVPQQSTSTQKIFKAQATPPTSVTLLKIQLSNNAWQKIQTRAEATEQHTAEQTTDASGAMLPAASKSVQLGMNNVPVLDQGPHSTCATFAATAAIDAALNQGDDISELCHLQLGLHLERNGYTISGWNGSLNATVLNQMRTFGLISKTVQREKGCGGLTEYPTRSGAEPQTDMSVADFHALSEALPDERVSWTPVLDVYQVFIDKMNPDTTLQNVKSALDAGDRMTFGVLLFGLDEGLAGAVGKHHAYNDSWVLTPEIIKNIEAHGEFGGHAMIITGYDNDATAIDSHGRSHKGLLTLRNSWGSQIGDKGDFYMSYDYFKTLTLEIQRIRQLD